MNHIEQVNTLINHQVNQSATPALQPVKDCLLEQYQDSVQAILYYGSCLRSDNPYDGLIDLYVLVNEYSHAYPGKPVIASVNWLLPPNVFYLETGTGKTTIRVKYALLSIADFEKACSPAWFNSYIWGRFSQPSRLLYCRNNALAKQIVSALSQAAITFINRVVPTFENDFNSQTLWSEGLGLSYSTELRPEKPGRTLEIYQNDQTYYDALTGPLLNAISREVEALPDQHSPQYRSKTSPRQHRMSQLAWLLRRIQGKVLTVARLVKATFTFQGGVDYIAWKIERHSGIQIKITDKLRRYPLVYGWGVLWKLHRQGVLRS